MTNLLLLPARQWAECLVLFCRQKRDVCRHRADSSPVFEGIARSCGRTLGLDFMIKHPEQFVHHYTLSWCSLCSVFFNQYIRLASQEAAKPKVFILKTKCLMYQNGVVIQLSGQLLYLLSSYSWMMWVFTCIMLGKVYPITSEFFFYTHNDESLAVTLVQDFSYLCNLLFFLLACWVSSSGLSFGEGFMWRGSCTPMERRWRWLCLCAIPQKWWKD